MKGLPEGIQVRLTVQAEALHRLVEDAKAADLDTRPAPDEWSARENLAHLARHQAVFLGRLDRIVREDSPSLGRYRAEDDPEWPTWRALPIDEVRRRHRDARRRLVAWVSALTVEETTRIGVHPTFGPMSLPRWLEFFLLHEAHHLYIAMVRLGEARGRGARGPDQG